jgi:hypothetical protein
LPQHKIVSGQESPQGRKKKMKKTLLTIGLALATMPLTFAAQSPASTPAAQSNSGQTATAPAKKVKKVKKTKKPAAAANSTATPSNTSAPATHK